MSATWIAIIIASLAPTSAIAVLIWRAGHWAGKIDSALERLTAIVEDQEDRIRFFEGRRAHRRH